MHSYDLFSAWLKQGNSIYFGSVIVPSILNKKRLKNPLTFNWIERIGTEYFISRFRKIAARRLKQNRVSIIEQNELSYSSVRVPAGFHFVLVPVYLFFKAIWAYLRLEFSELKYILRK